MTDSPLERGRRAMRVALGVTLGVLACTAGGAADEAYVKEIEEYRRDRETRLRAPEGWLSLVGLFWLEPGDNAFGTDPGLPIVLPAGPPRAGTLTLDGTTVRLVANPGVEIMLAGEKIAERDLIDDLDGEPDVVRLDRLMFQVIRRNDRLGLRVKDPESPVRLGFLGLEHFPIDAKYRVVARFEPYDEPRTVQLATSAGVVEEMYVPGRLIFELDGKQRSLEPLVSRPGETRLFLIFRDETSGTETYGAGRYLYANLENGAATVDFNRAYNPPCAFTSFATCPLPPRGNRLPIAVRAGEKRYAGR